MSGSIDLVTKNCSDHQTKEFCMQIQKLTHEHQHISTISLSLASIYTTINANITHIYIMQQHSPPPPRLSPCTASSCSDSQKADQPQGKVKEPPI